MSSPSLNEALHRLLHAYKKQLRASIRQHRISLPITHIRVLKGVGRLPDCTAMAIAQRMGQDKSRVTRVLNSLMDEGLIERADHPNDRRSQLVTATEAGREMLETITVLEEEAASRLTDRLGPEEVETFLRIAATMTASADDHDTEPEGSQEHG
ncbi:MarR family winged helix-turn-helix transcriptional regulator [Halomonas sp. B23F22_10]|uniref:MarR family winged helix-turn-helix transcriptional regulator n=1 Tax=Halomonas sp. B23F22_10 TaxID=3459515 RepID=UPI00373E54A5